MSSEDNKQLLERLFEEVWRAGTLSVADELLAPDYTAAAPGDTEIRGAEGLKALVTDYRTGFPDLEVTVNRHLAEGDRVVTEYWMKATHTGTWSGVRATRKAIDLGGCAFSQVTDGRIVRQWYEWDRRAILEQVGIMPGV